jgi:hypothetical protein
MINAITIAIMRKSMIVLGAVFMVASCNKDGNDREPPAHVNALSAHVNGVAYKSKSTEVYISGTSVPGARSVGIYATMASGRELFLNMHVYDETLKTFNNETNLSGGIGCYSSPTAYLGIACGSDGEIILTSIDKDKYKTGQVASGNFHFETDSTEEHYDISDGNFSVFIPDN